MRSEGISALKSGGNIELIGQNSLLTSPKIRLFEGLRLMDTDKLIVPGYCFEKKLKQKTSSRITERGLKKGK